MSVVESIRHYQRSIERCPENHERMIHCLSKLYRLPVTVQHLQDTGVGRTVNNLRRYEGDTGEAAKALVAKWKAMVAAEDSSECEEQPDPEENNNSPDVPEEEQQEEPERHRSKEKVSHRRHSDSSSSGRKHREEVKTSKSPKKSSSHDHSSKKRRHGEENGKVTEKRRRKHETESDSSEEEDGSDNGSEARSTSQTSQAMDNESSDESSEPAPRVKHHTSHHKHEKHKERHSKDKERSHSSHKSHKAKTEENRSSDESKHRKDEKRRVEEHKKQKSKSSNHIPESSKSSHSSKKVKPKKEKGKEETEDGIDCSTGASFAEALGMVDPVVKKKSQSVPSTSSSSSRSSTKPRVETGSGSSSSNSSTLKKKDTPTSNSSRDLNLLSPNIKLEPLEMEVDLDATLPAITPNYKPLPHYNVMDSPPHRKTKHLTEEEALCQVMSTKNQRQDQSVLRSKEWQELGPVCPPCMTSVCVYCRRTLMLWNTREVFLMILLKPVLQHANPDQLFMLEHHNPYLIEDTGELWQFHCNKEFRTKQRQDMETPREMYLRCLDEREAKLKALTTNIQQSIAKSTPVRQTKLAYVDSVAKPPRNVARQQAKYGTAKVTKPTTPTQAKVARLSGAAGATPVPAPVRHITTATKVKPRMAPLMQKTMKLAKSFKR